MVPRITLWLEFADPGVSDVWASHVDEAFSLSWSPQGVPPDCTGPRKLHLPLIGAGGVLVGAGCLGANCQCAARTRMRDLLR
jgi:hypothetical protein